ncbi:MAG: cell division ATP-binding protein FtsE [Lysobacterales bacterium]|jgi:cell division transport system ATP-binding protein|nr:MAG: cell division ATP-binding protein FtsE [Xanthomonadales bacterium]
MLRFEEVSKSYPGGGEALRGVSFSVAEGELVFLTGHSGAGKSTVFRLISMQERATRGRVLFGGIDLARAKRRERAALRRELGLVFQDHRLLPEQSALANVELPLLIAGLPAAERRRRARAALELVGLGERLDASPQRLSAGEQQRVGIARAIVRAPSLLIADEPTGNLDPQLSFEIMRLFASLARHGMAVLIATHDLGIVERIGARTLTLEHGRLVSDRPAEASS